jgi:hypothetical protein
MVGAPHRFVSDNGPQFLSKLFQNLLKDWGVTQTLISSWVERVNRNLRAMLSSYHYSDHRRWADYIPELQYALNSVKHNTTGKSPAVVVFLGRQLQGPGDNAVLSIPNPLVNTAQLDEEVAQETAKHMASNKANYDPSRSSGTVFREGDLVNIGQIPPTVQC